MAEAAAAKLAATGSGSDGAPIKRELPPAMVEVLKVSLSLLRRLCIRNLANVTSPFSSGMPMWHSAPPQVPILVNVSYLVLSLLSAVVVDVIIPGVRMLAFDSYSDLHGGVLGLILLLVTYRCFTLSEK